MLSAVEAANATLPQTSPMKRAMSTKVANAFQKSTMNRFLTKKRAKRAAPEPPKFELDLSTVLPRTDDFRTSLLMNGLSARFSMLREQDDPTSLLGKASDDSILQNKRQSRLYEFGFQPTGLHDIAEVASLNSSTRIKPPFVAERSNSCSSDAGYNTDGESIMNRAKPAEGNVLFGGRQKITRIAGDGKGKTLYDDDVSMSTFQKWRAEERLREKQAAQSSGKFSFDEESRNPAKGGSYSISTAGSSLRRQTSSSTSTSYKDSRASTAATSINSQAHFPHSASSTSVPYNYSPPTSTTPASGFDQSHERSGPPPAPSSGAASGMERSTTKRRLYDQGLTRDCQEQQHSAMSRLQLINKRTGSNGNAVPDHWQQRFGFGASETPRKMSQSHSVRSTSPSSSPVDAVPVPAGLLCRDVHFAKANTDRSPSSSASRPGTSGSNHKQVLATAMDPKDRGKATAMGVFNKPKKFDERQFLERQMTLRKERETMSPQPEPVPVLEEHKEYDRLQGEATKSKAIDDVAPAVRDVTASSDKVKTEAPHATTGFSVFQRAAMLMKAAGTANPEPEPESRKDSPQLPTQNKFEFVDDSGSEYEDDEKADATAKALQSDRKSTITRVPDPSTLIAPPQHEHPAFRITPQPSQENLREEARKTSADLQSKAPSPKFDLDKGSVDSPTLGPVFSSGLSGMVRQHLRNASETSRYSTATDTVPPTPSFPPELQTRDFNQYLGTQQSAGAITPADSLLGQPSPWQLENAIASSTDSSEEIDHRDTTAAAVEGHKAEKQAATILPLKSAMKKHGPTESAWQEELSKKVHTRDGSSETQIERAAFASELQARQKAIQEKLREKTGGEPRSASPPRGPKLAFKGILKSRPSMEQFRSRSREPGMPRPYVGEYPSHLNLDGRPSWDTERQPQPPRSVPIPMPSREQQAGGYGPYHSPSSTSVGHGREDQAQPGASSSISSQRSRSDSEQSKDRSRSRNGRKEQDEISRGAPYSKTTIPERLPPQHPAPEHPIPSLPATPNEIRGRTDPRTAGPGHIDANALWPHQKPLLHPLGIPSPRPSPGLTGQASPSAFPPPRPPISGYGLGGPSPTTPGHQAPFAPYATLTPPLSADSTPTTPSFTTSSPNLPTTTNATLAPNGLQNVGSRFRKTPIKKSDISDPILISTTSVIDTIDLPPGASLRNGMEAPPDPPVSFRRKRFGFGRADTEPVARDARHSGEHARPRPHWQGHRLKKSNSDGDKTGLYLRAQQQGAAKSTPALQNLQASLPPSRDGMF